MSTVRVEIKNARKNLPKDKDTLVFPVKTFELWKEVLKALNEMWMIVEVGEEEWEDYKEDTCICIHRGGEVCHGYVEKIYSDEYFLPDLLDTVTNEMTLQEALKAMIDGEKIEVIGRHEWDYMYFTGSYFCWEDGTEVSLDIFTEDARFIVHKEAVTKEETPKVKMEKWAVEYHQLRCVIEVDDIDSWCVLCGYKKIKLLSTTEVEL